MLGAGRENGVWLWGERMGVGGRGLGLVRWGAVGVGVYAYVPPPLPPPALEQRLEILCLRSESQVRGWVRVMGMCLGLGSWLGLGLGSGLG